MLQFCLDGMILLWTFLQIDILQSGQIAASGSQTRLPDAAVLPTMLYGCKFLNLNFKLEFNLKLTIIVQMIVLETT